MEQADLQAVDADGTATPLTLIAPVRLPNAGALTAPAAAALAAMRLTTVATADDYAMVTEDLGDIKARAAALDEQRKSITGPIRAAEKAVNDAYRGALDAYAAAEAHGKGLLLAYDREQARLAAIERQRLAEAAAAEKRRIDEAAAKAKAEADAEQRRLREQAEAEADRQRQAAAEAARLQREADEAAAAGRAAEAAAAQQAAQASQEAAQKAAQAAEAAAIAAQDVAAQAELNSAMAAQSAAMVVSAAIAAPLPAAGQAKGTIKRVRWIAAVTDKAAALRHIAAHPELHNLVEFNQSALNKLADAQADGFNLPGVQAVQDVSVGIRKR